MMMEILSSARAGAKPTPVASMLKQAKAAADFSKFRNAISSSPHAHGHVAVSEKPELLSKMIHRGFAAPEVVNRKSFIAIGDETDAGAPKLPSHYCRGALGVTARRGSNRPRD
jgi:hypothetical protein